ncbi:uncharacterized protein EHS24_005474 [Apiotrichum porosum]|uniref:Uncharacterized protein n=1 Tax=Apiotrichum porosum TaxID=105984 RepID=A0A427XCK1_9TREE|nr:uncharacterized protein EHS24_005474 [Apiotrichum porosum]RSH76589.1 hypothetical protein EHS24_005474 [Apiotrichum porosum]
MSDNHPPPAAGPQGVPESPMATRIKAVLHLDEGDDVNALLAEREQGLQEGGEAVTKEEQDLDCWGEQLHGRVPTSHRPPPKLLPTASTSQPDQTNYTYTQTNSSVNPASQVTLKETTIQRLLQLMGREAVLGQRRNDAAVREGNIKLPAGMTLGDRESKPPKEAKQTKNNQENTYAMSPDETVASDPILTFTSEQWTRLTDVALQAGALDSMDRTLRRREANARSLVGATDEPEEDSGPSQYEPIDYSGVLRLAVVPTNEIETAITKLENDVQDQRNNMSDRERRVASLEESLRKPGKM